MAPNDADADTDESELETTRDPEALLDLDQGDQIILDQIEGRFTLLREEHTGALTHVGWTVLDEDLNTHMVRYADAAGGFLQFVPDGDTPAVINVDNPCRSDDFEVVGHDRQPIEEYVADLHGR